MAHELAHVKNRDTLIMTMTATIAGAISMLANFGLFFRGNDGRGNIVAILLAVIVAPFAAMIVQLAISRTREYGADAAARRCTAIRARSPRRWPSSPRGAEAVPSPVAARNPAAASLYIVPGLGRGDSLVLHPPGDREPDRRAGGDGRGDGPAFAAAAAGRRPAGDGGAESRRGASALDPLGRRD